MNAKGITTNDITGKGKPFTINLLEGQGWVLMVYPARVTPIAPQRGAGDLQRHHNRT